MKAPLLVFLLLMAGSSLAQSVKPLPPLPPQPPFNPPRNTAFHPALSSAQPLTPRPFATNQDVLLWSDLISPSGLPPVPLTPGDTLGLRLQARQDTTFMLLARSETGQVYPLDLSRTPVFVKAGTVVALKLSAHNLQPGLNDILAVSASTYAQARVLAAQNKVAATLQVKVTDGLSKPAIRDMRPQPRH